MKKEKLIIGVLLLVIVALLIEDSITAEESASEEAMEVVDSETAPTSPIKSLTAGDDMSTVLSFFQEAGNYFVSTLQNKKPRVRAVALYGVSEGKLILATAKGKAFYQQLMAHPQIEVLAYNGENYSTARLSGKIVFEKDMDTITKIRDGSDLLSKFYAGDKLKSLAVYYLQPQEAILYGGAWKK